MGTPPGSIVRGVTSVGMGSGLFMALGAIKGEEYRETEGDECSNAGSDHCSQRNLIGRTRRGHTGGGRG